jgi:hypothetical protein
MSATDTYRIAHTAACKLQLAADRPDRNLRFILGHAFTLDKIRLQIARIEEDADSDEDEEEADRDIPTPPSPGVVSFPRSANRPVAFTRRKSPPPENHAQDISSDEDVEEEEEEEDLRLERFGSAAGLPPRMIDDEGSDEEDEPPSPPGTPSKQELKVLTEGDANPGLTDMYQRVAGCPCHGHEAPAAEKVWDIPQTMEKEGPRLAVVQVTG